MTSSSKEMTSSSKEMTSSSKEMEKDYSKYSFLPIKYPNLLSFYDKQKKAFWTPQELDFSKDRKDWESLSNDEKKFLTFVLAFFAQADGLVIENLFENFQRETSEYKEITAFYSAQNFMETIHNETYSLMIESFIQDLDERKKALNAIENYPSIKNLADWICDWMDSSKSTLLERIIAFACVEGTFFNGAFCAIYWIKKSNKLRGLCKANEFIARDEALHTDFAVELYHHYTSITKKFERLEEEKVHNIISSAMNVSEKFIKDALQVELIGMNSDDMIKYVKFTADRLLVQLKYKKLYSVENPFDWMVLITLENKTNFFEDRVSEYSKVSDKDYEFKLTDEF
jgi:ribonucleotide reductase beta subunit family protein with ferritin-like domain